MPLYQEIRRKKTSGLCTVFCIFSLVFCIQGYALSYDINNLLLKLRHDDPNVRLSAIEELGRIGNNDSVRALMSVIENQGEDWKIQIRTVKLLATIENLIVVDLLIKILEDPFFTYDCPALKWNAAIALGNFKGYPKVVDVLINALDDKILYVREAAIQSLGEIGSRKAVPYLISALSDKSFAIRISAIKALGKIGDESAIPFVKRVLDNDTDPHIRDEAAKVLKRLNAN